MFHHVRFHIPLAATGALLVVSLAASVSTASAAGARAQSPQIHVTGSAAPQVKAPATPPPAQADRKPAADEGPARSVPELRHLKYRSLGPARGGRVDRVAGVAGDPRVYYAATAQRGVWKSIDGGVTWKPIFDDQPVATIGSIAVAPSDPNVVYVGTGEANIRGNVQDGDGIYKSTDAGKTWKHVWTERGQIGTIIVHPTNPDIAFAAVLGRTFGPNPERGVYRTLDGGKTWQQVLKKDTDTGASDVAFDPSNPHIALRRALAGAAQALGPRDERRPGSGLYVSRDGGDTWKAARPARGCPRGIWGKVGVAVAPSTASASTRSSRPRRAGLFRSDDGGETWERVSGHRRAAAAGLVLLDDHRRPERTPTSSGSRRCRCCKTIDGGKTVVSRSRGRTTATTTTCGSTRTIRERMIVAQRRRRGRLDRRRRDLVRAAAAARAVLPRRRRQPGARTTSAARCRTGAPRPGRATA